MGNEIEKYIKVLFSNRLESLADALAEQLFAPGTSVFQRRYVIVPHEQIKGFLHFYLASKLGIAAGMHVCSIEKGITELLDYTRPHDKKRVPGFLELSIYIEEQIFILLESPSLRDTYTYRPFYAYIDAQDIRVKERRILALTDQLARLFIRYSLYGSAFLSDWLSEEGWQQQLWKSIFSQEGIISLNKIRGTPAPGIQVHLFGFSYLPPLYLDFFARIEAMFYLFSPCAQYWDDLCSDKEKLSIERKLRSSKTGPSVYQDMHRYLQDHHPLLANWGKWGREFVKGLDAYPLDVTELYQPSLLNLLGCVKNSMLYNEDRALLSGHKHSYLDDRSIQFHSAPSKLRELEVLRDVISNLMAQHASDPVAIEPKDILVLAPDIAEYASYIHMVFAEGPYAYRIEGLEQGSTSDFCQAFYYLLSFYEEEFSLSHVLKLLFFQSFRQRWGFCLEDVYLIRTWLENAHVRTGEKSWQEGIDRLLFGLALLSDTELEGIVYPLNCIGHADVELFNRFLICYDTLKQDVFHMRSNVKKSLAEWLIWIEELALRHCDCDGESEPLLRELRLLVDQTSVVLSPCFSFTSIHRILRHLYEKRTGSLLAGQLQHVCFLSLHPGAVRPARIIYILGADEEHFPRFESPLSLCALSKSPKKPYLPLKGDEDRYLFLELLCSAEKYFIASYERIHPRDNKPQGPSYLIDELRTYIKKAFSIAVEEIHHPFFAFDAQYFTEDAPIKSMRTADFLLAQSYYNAKSKQRHFFADSESKSSPSQLPEIVRLSSLRSLAKDPFKFYFNEVLGMYLKKEEAKEEARFCLSALKKFFLKRASRKEGWEKVICNTQRQGFLPEGIFKQIALQDLFEEKEDYGARCEKLHIKTDEIFSVDLSLHCRHPMRLQNGNWVLPPLVCELEGKGTFHLSGTLSDLTPQGFLVQGKKDIDTLVAEWPLYLLFLNIRHTLGDLPEKILFFKDANQLEIALDHPLEMLKEYLIYYLRARLCLSPLRPKWASCLLLKNQQEFEKTVDSSLHKQEGFYNDPYIDWMKQSQITIDPQKMYVEWASDLKHQFEPLLTRLGDI